MAAAIPRLAERIDPLRSVLEVVFEKLGTGINKSIAGLRLSQVGRSPTMENTYEGMQEQLTEAFNTTDRHPMLTLRLHKDASHAHWAAALAQCCAEDLNQHISEQFHDPQDFLSGTFSDTPEH